MNPPKNFFQRYRAHWPYLAGILIGFIVARVIARVAGVQFDASATTFLAHQFIDPQLLRDDLLQSVWYSHSQPPLFNLFIGAVLKAFPGEYKPVFHLIYVLIGFCETVAVYALLVRLGSSRLTSAIVAGGMAVLPAALLYENWLFYDYIVTALLVFVVLTANIFVSRPTTLRSFVFFSLVAVTILTRSSYQVWWMLLLAIALLLVMPSARRALLLGLALPLLVVLLVYGKNMALYGVPTTSSWLGQSLFHITVEQLPKSTREQMIKDGELSAVARVNAFSPPSAYRGLVKQPKRRGVTVLDQPLRSNNTANLNNLIYLKISDKQFGDALTVIKRHPDVYLGGVWAALGYYFSPSTDYLAFPVALPDTPEFRNNRDRLGAWRAVVDTVLYGQARPIVGERGVGIVIVLGYLVVLLYGAWVAYLLVRRRSGDPIDVTFLVIWLVVLYSTAAFVLLDVGENDRFHSAIDPLVVVALTVIVRRWWQRHSRVSTVVEN